MDMEKTGLIAQKISFAFEDDYADIDKRKKFVAFFDKYLAQADPTGTMQPYDAMMSLARSNPEDFEKMVEEMEKAGLI